MKIQSSNVQSSLQMELTPTPCEHPCGSPVDVIILPTNGIDSYYRKNCPKYRDGSVAILPSNGSDSYLKKSERRLEKVKGRNPAFKWK